jgi:hypothetical protein
MAGIFGIPEERDQFGARVIDQPEIDLDELPPLEADPMPAHRLAIPLIADRRQKPATNIIERQGQLAMIFPRRVDRLRERLQGFGIDQLLVEIADLAAIGPKFLGDLLDDTLVIARCSPLLDGEMDEHGAFLRFSHVNLP